MTLTDRQKDILRHTLGIKQDGDKSHRNHFIAGENHVALQDLSALVQAGYMTVRNDCSRLVLLYQATDKGREALGLPPA